MWRAWGEDRHEDQRGRRSCAHACGIEANNWSIKTKRVSNTCSIIRMRVHAKLVFYVGRKIYSPFVRFVRIFPFDSVTTRDLRSLWVTSYNSRLLNSNDDCRLRYTRVRRFDRRNNNSPSGLCAGSRSLSVSGVMFFFSPRPGHSCDYFKRDVIGPVRLYRLGYFPPSLKNHLETSCFDLRSILANRVRCTDLTRIKRAAGN